MEIKMERPQVAKGLCLVILLLFIPFTSSSLRNSYLYFLLNLLIVALGVEAGLLSAISKPHEEKKSHTTTKPSASIAATEAIADEAAGGVSYSKAVGKRRHQRSGRATMLVTAEKAALRVAPRAQTLKRCVSTKPPSLFFIGNGAAEGESTVKDSASGDADRIEELSKQELFAKAEAFIGDFYMQLKMQREDSWQKINEFYHKTF